jgi:hypothetical protein
MTRAQRNRRLLGVVVSLLLLAACSPRLQAHPADRSSEEQVKEATEQALRMAHTGSGNENLKIRRRLDLEEDLSNIAGKPVMGVYFFEIQSPPLTAVDDGSITVVAVASSPGDVYQLYSFEASQGFSGLSQQFNRLIHQLTLSIPNEKATSLARLFLACCVGGEFNDIVLDEEGLRHAVERYYLQIYGDIWRTLDVYLGWWQGFQKNAPDLAPTIRIENGGYRVGVKKILIIDGKHPQLQEWEFEISRNGNVRVLAVEPIFPKPTRWLFYDFRSTVSPPLI